MVMEVGISVQSRANLTGVTSSWGSRSTWAWSMRRQKDARRSKGRVSSIMHRKISSTSSCLEISSIARYWRSKHIRANSFSWYLRKSTEAGSISFASFYHILWSLYKSLLAFYEIWSEWLFLFGCTYSKWGRSHHEHFLVLPPEPAVWCFSPVSH